MNNEDKSDYQANPRRNGKAKVMKPLRLTPAYAAAAAGGLSGLRVKIIRRYDYAGTGNQARRRIDEGLMKIPDRWPERTVTIHPISRIRHKNRKITNNR